MSLRGKAEAIHVENAINIRRLLRFARNDTMRRMTRNYVYDKIKYVY